MDYQICCVTGISQSSVFSVAKQSGSWENIMISTISYVCYTSWILWSTAVLHLSFPARAWSLMKITALQSWQIKWTLRTVLVVMFLFRWPGTCKSISVSIIWMIARASGSVWTCGNPKPGLWSSLHCSGGSPPIILDEFSSLSCAPGFSRWHRALCVRKMMVSSTLMPDW